MDNVVRMETGRIEKVQKSFDEQISKVPPGAFIALAIGSIAISASYSAIRKDRDLANFVGLWAPTLLLFGLYSKLVSRTHEKAS